MEGKRERERERERETHTHTHTYTDEVMLPFSANVLKEPLSSGMKETSSSSIP
jgi:hypothetical protein